MKTEGKIMIFKSIKDWHEIELIYFEAIIEQKNACITDRKQLKDLMPIK